MHEEKETEESEKPINLDDAMKELDEKIALVKRRGTWDGVDVDKYMDEVRGREPEKPINLEEEINRYLHEECSDDDEPGIHEIAEHFAEWGYLRAAEKYNEIEYNQQRASGSSEIPKDLEDAAWDCVLDSVDVNNPVLLPRYKDLLTYLFVAGAKWQKQHDAELIEIAYNDGITIGTTKQKEQMMKEAVEGEVMTNGFYPYEPRIVISYPGCPYEFGEKVRLVIIKED